MVETSVVVPVYDDPAGVRRTLDSLVDQTATDYEVVAVDNGSTDRTPAVVEAFAASDGGRGAVRHVTERAIQGSYAARNTGIDAARGEFLLFLDADTRVRPTYVERVTDAMRAGDHDYVGCRVVVPGGGGPVGRFVSATAFPVERYLAAESFAPTCCLGVRRRVVESVGPFDDLLVSGGDVEFGQRVAAAGFDQAYLPDVAVSHPARDSPGALWAKYARVGRGREQLARHHPDRFDPYPLWDPRNYLPGRPRRPSGDSPGPRGPADVAVWVALTWFAKLAVAAGRLYERGRLGVAAGGDGPAGGARGGSGGRPTERANRRVTRMREPAVSVVIPTYNRAPVLGRAVESVLSQTRADLELVVVDDGSTDRTPSLLDGYDDDRLVTLRSGDNRGANAARNRGIAESRGEYVAFLDSDDAYDERYLERSLAALEEAGEHCVGTYGSRVWYRDGERWNLTVADGDVARADVRRKNVVGGFSNVLLRRSTLDRVGGLDPDLPACQDYDLFLRALSEPDHRLLAVPDAVVRYHVHDEGAGRIGDDRAARVAGHERVLEKHGDALTAAGRANQYYQLGMTHARAGDVGSARAWFRRGLRTDPRSWRHWYHYLASLGGLGLLRVATGVKIRAKRTAYRLVHDPG